MDVTVEENTDIRQKFGLGLAAPVYRIDCVKNRLSECGTGIGVEAVAGEKLENALLIEREDRWPGCLGHLEDNIARFFRRLAGTLLYVPPALVVEQLDRMGRVPQLVWVLAGTVHTYAEPGDRGGGERLLDERGGRKHILWWY